MSSIIQYIREGDTLSAIIAIISRCFVVFCCMPIHELAHGLIANKLGDDTARLKGRLTINPFAHLDLIGTIMIFLFGIGYAKPVPVNARRLKKPRRDMALIAIAGPISNLLMSFVSAFVLCAVVKFSGNATPVAEALFKFFYFAAAVNISLAVFNILPIPPLDGSKVLASILPNKVYFKYLQYERYIMIALMVILFLGLLNGPIGFLSGLMMKIVLFVPSLIFGVTFV